MDLQFPHHSYLCLPGGSGYAKLLPSWAVVWSGLGPTITAVRLSGSEMERFLYMNCFRPVSILVIALSRSSRVGRKQKV
jgi:hypothetical protein